jgi:hypothetical protein
MLYEKILTVLDPKEKENERIKDQKRGDILNNIPKSKEKQCRDTKIKRWVKQVIRFF